jgi:hypothetical protein
MTPAAVSSPFDFHKDIRLDEEISPPFPLRVKLELPFERYAIDLQMLD